MAALNSHQASKKGQPSLGFLIQQILTESGTYYLLR